MSKKSKTEPITSKDALLGLKAHYHYDIDWETSHEEEYYNIVLKDLELLDQVKECFSKVCLSSNGDIAIKKDFDIELLKEIIDKLGYKLEKKDDKNK